MEEKLPRPALGDIRLDEVAEDSWRVADKRFRETNPRTVLGFIQRVDGRYEVLDVRRSGERGFYDNRDAAIAAFLSSEPALFESV
jgi:hypothetical protein